MKSRLAIVLLTAVSVLFGAAVADASVFGWTGGLSETGTLANWMRGSQFRSGDTGYVSAIYVYLSPSATFDNLHVKCAIYECDSAGTSNTLVANGETETRSLSTFNLPAGWYRFEIIGTKPYLTNRWYNVVAWAEQGTIANWEIGDTNGTANLSYITRYSSTYGAWPASYTSILTGSYNRCIYVAYCHGTDLLIYHDSADFVMGQVSPASVVDVIVDTAYANADGDLEEWTVISGDKYTYVDETTPDDDGTHMYVSFTTSLKTDFVDLAPDTTYTSLDSVRIISRCFNDGAGAISVQILYDIGAGDVVLDTFAVPNGGTWTTDISRPITGLTKADLMAMEIGVKNLGAVARFKTVKCTWLVLEMFEDNTIAAHDIWADPYLKIGAISGEANRAFVVIRNTDSLGEIYTDWIDTLVYLRMAMDSGPAAITRYATPRLIYPQGATPGVKPAAANDAAYGHSDWVHWNTDGDTAWAVPGADSADVDWYPADFDSVAFVRNTIVTIDITAWVNHLWEVPRESRAEANGIMFFVPEETSETDDWRKFGNVQPFAGTDSSWIEVYRYWNGIKEPTSAGGVRFGYCSGVPGTTYGIENYIRGYSAAATDTGTADSMFAYLDFPGTGAYTFTLKLGLYRDMGLGNADTLYDSTEARTFASTTADGYQGFAFTGTKPKIYATPVIYYMAGWAQNQTSGNVYLRRQAGSGSDVSYSISRTYGTWPATLTFSSGQVYKMGICCQYTQTFGGGAAASGRRRRLLLGGGG